MLNNKMVLCLGNNTTETDELTSKLAAKYNSKNFGLIDRHSYVPTEIGFYHSSLHDLDKENMLDLACKFNHVILWNQPKETFDNVSVFYETRHILNLIKLRFNIPTEILDA